MAVDSSIATLSLYSNAACTVNELEYDVGETIHINGNITAAAATTGTTVLIQCYKQLTTDSLKATPLDTTHNFTNNTAQSIKTNINATVAPTIDTTGYTTGKYYLKLTLSGTGVETTKLYVGFVIVVAIPVISAPAFSDDPINVNEQLMVTANETNTEEAFVVFYDPDGSEIIYSQHMFVGGGIIRAVIPPNSLKPGNYVAGKIKLKAIGGGASAIDSTLTLTVNPKVLPDYEVYQAEVLKRIVQLLMDYQDNNGVKIFEQFKGHIFYKAKLSIPTSKYPAMFLMINNVSREPLAIKRQDWWVLNVKIMLYSFSPSEDDMAFHYACIEGIDRVCRVNPHLDKTGEPELSIHKADLSDANYDFSSRDNAIISESESTITVRTKLCLAKQIS